LTRLTVFSRLLARHASRRGLVDHKWSITTSGGREKPTFGGPNPSIWCVAALARYTVSRYALRLPECTDLTPSNGSIITFFGIIRLRSYHPIPAYPPVMVDILCKT